MTIDQIVSFEGDMPGEVTIEDKGLVEQVKLIQNLDHDEKNMVFKLIDTFLTQKKIQRLFPEKYSCHVK